MRVAIVNRIGINSRGKNLLADSVHADVVARNERLKMRRPVGEQVETFELVRTEPTDNRADTTRRFVDHVSVLGMERTHRHGVAGDERRRHAKTRLADDKRLIRLGVVGSTAAHAVDHRAGEAFDERNEGEVSLMPERRCCVPVKPGQRRAIFWPEEANIDAADSRRPSMWARAIASRLPGAP